MLILGFGLVLKKLMIKCGVRYGFGFSADNMQRNNSNEMNQFRPHCIFAKLLDH